MPVKNAFNKINNSNEIHLNIEDTLLNRFVQLHNFGYKLLEEWGTIDRNFVLNQALPYMEENAPFYISPDNPLTPGIGYSFDGRVFYELRKKDSFMNLLKSGKLYKTAMLQVYQGNYAGVNSYLAKLRSMRLDAEE